MSDFEAEWLQHVIGSNTRRWYLEHIWVCLRRAERVLNSAEPGNGHITRPERPEMGLLSGFEWF